jgi:serine/threonine-protein kinase
VLKKLGKYKIVEEIGRGAMGDVYKAIDPSIGRLVALKTISSSLVGNPELLERFYREARSAGALEHPNIVTIYELGKGGDVPYIAMEYLEGESLEKIIQRRQSLGFLEKIGFIVPVCRALEYAHSRGVVHRDVKPANVMISKDGKIKVVDFGIARLMNASHTQTDVLIGTISYMSPQMIYGERADERSDIWALGVTFYELLCYQRPFEAENHATLMLKIAQESAKHAPVSDFVPDCPPELELIISKMLEKELTRRFQTMEEVLSEIEPLWEGFRQASVSGLISECESLLNAKEFARARELLRKAQQIDSRNQRVKVLFDQVNSGIRQVQVKVQAANILECAVQLQQRGRYQEARAEAEAALKLDPGSSHARELLAELQHQAERKHAIEQGLQLARKFVAEDTLSKASQEIQKVLEIDGENVQSLALQKQIQDLLARREEQRRVADLLQQARNLWAEQSYEACFQFLTDGQKEFPSDPEIAKLLEAARLEYAEQRRVEGLAETRSLLAMRKFDEALAKTQSLAERYPLDSAVQKLRELVLHEKEQMARRQKLSTEIAALRSRINAGRLFEAVGRGERLLKEFPEERELADLVNFARGEFEQAERKRKKEEFLEGIQKKIEAEHFKGAVSLAEKALARFPEDTAFSVALKEARARLKEREDRDLLQRRVSEVRAKINKGQHTDAVDLARQTLATFGQNEQTADLLRMAEVELAQKRKNQKENETLSAVPQAAAEKNRDAEATRTPGDDFEVHLLEEEDPHVTHLLKEVQGKPAPARLEEAPVHIDEIVEQSLTVAPTLIEFVSLSQEPVQTAAAQLAEPTTTDATEEELSAAAVSGARPELELVIMAPPVPQPSPAQEESVLHLDEPVERKTSAAPLVRNTFLQRAVQVIRAKPVLFGPVALLLIISILSISYAVSSRPTKRDLALRAQAQHFEQEKNWPAALSTFESLAHSHSNLAGVGRDNASRLTKLLGLEHSLQAQAQDRETAGDLAGAQQIYQQIASLHGDEEQSALSSVQRLDAALSIIRLPPTPGTSHQQSKSSIDPAETQGKETSKTVTERCQLDANDVPRRLERANKEHGNGHYIDAERLYKEVLACEPNNAQAREGLDKTRKAKGLAKEDANSN